MPIENDALLDAVLETLIPPSEDGRMPGAGTLGLAPAVRVAASPMAEVLDAGLETLRGAGFEQLDPQGRDEALRRFEASEPAFTQGLYQTACTQYYAHPRVLAALGLEPGAPFPKGHTLDSGDLAALDKVRARGKLYREA